ncbi:tetratricopeptide repeat protein [bacterium]|nr:tetratricopeptide repeat protein [bacterium]
MKKKLILSVVLLSLCSSVYADTVVERKIVPRRTAIQSTNMVFSDSQYTVNKNTLDVAIKEIQNKISQDTDDYSLYASLANLYIKAKQYDNAYEELVFLNHLASKNLLNEETLSVVSEIKKNLNKVIRYERNWFGLYSNLAIVNLILSDNQAAQQCILSASRKITNPDMFADVFGKVYNAPATYEAAVETIDKILAANPDAILLKKLKSSYYLEMGRKDDAIKEMVSVLAVAKDDSDLRYQLYTLLQDKNLKEKDLIKKLYPNQTVEYEKVYSELANMLFDKNDFQDAKKYATALVTKFPENADGYIMLSEINLKEGNLREAYEALKYCRDKVNDNDAVAKYNVLLAKLSDEPVKEADSLMNNGLYSQALSVLESASQENLYVILGTARANYFLNNKQAALDGLNKAMTLYPNNADVFYYFAYVFYKEGDIDSSRKYLEKTFNVNPEHTFAKQLLDLLNKNDADKYSNQIISAFEAQNYDEAMRLTDEALAINPKDAALYYYKGLTYIAMNNYASATAPLYKSIDLDKTNTLAYFYLALSFDNLSEPENALSYYQKFIQLLPKDELGESEKLNYAKARIEKLSK